MRIHAGTSGTLPREVGRSLSGQDQVFLPGKKIDIPGLQARIFDLKIKSVFPYLHSGASCENPLLILGQAKNSELLLRNVNKYKKAAEI